MKDGLNLHAAWQRAFVPSALVAQRLLPSKAEALVKILISPGMGAHDYQATPDDAKLLADADVLVENGLGFEEFLSALVANAGNSNLQQITASEGIEVLVNLMHHNLSVTQPCILKIR